MKLYPTYKVDCLDRTLTKLECFDVSTGEIKLFNIPDSMKDILYFVQVFKVDEEVQIYLNQDRLLVQTPKNIFEKRLK